MSSSERPELRSISWRSTRTILSNSKLTLMMDPNDPNDPNDDPKLTELMISSVLSELCLISCRST